MPGPEDRILRLVRLREILIPSPHLFRDEVVLANDLSEIRLGHLADIERRDQVFGDPIKEARLRLLRCLFELGFESNAALGQLGIVVLAERNHVLSGAVQDAVERVVICRRDRIEFVVVTARTGNRQTEHPASDDIDAVIDDVLTDADKSSAEREVTHRG